jgi:hypothetical protein
MPFLTKRVSISHKQAIADYLVAEAPELVSEIPAKEVLLSFPHKQYVLGMDKLTDGSGLEAASVTSTRILVATAQEQVLAVAEVYPAAKGPHPIVLQTGQAITPLLSGLTAVAESTVLKQHDKIEMRSLSLMGLSMTAIWLHTAILDALMPIGVVPKGMKPNHLYQAVAFLRKVRSMAANQVEQEHVQVLQQRIALERERIKVEQQRIILEQERIAALRRTKTSAGSMGRKK